MKKSNGKKGTPTTKVEMVTCKGCGAYHKVPADMYESHRQQVARNHRLSAAGALLR